MQDVVNLISNVGFPIVITLIMFYFVENVADKYLTSVNDNIAKLDKSIDDLTVIVNRLEERVDKNNDENSQETSTTISNNQQN